MILNNAEFKRNLWLDFSLQRVVLSILIIGLICYIFTIGSSAQTGAYTAYVLAYFFIFLWGTRNSSDCVIEEVNQNTWDFQRQSAQTPFEMSFGKLIGSTAFAWYGALISICIYSYLRIDSIEPNGQLSSLFSFFSSHKLTLFHEILLLVICGLLTHSFALILSLQVISKTRHEKRIMSFRYFIIAFIVGSVIYNLVFSSSRHPGTELQWFQTYFNAQAFALISLSIFLLWSLVGVYRSFSKELQYAQTPWIWAGFNIFCIIYFAGFFSFSELSYKEFDTIKDLEVLFKSAPTYAALMIALLLGYSAISVDNLSYIQYKRCFSHFSKNQNLEGLQSIPLWSISLICILATAIVALSNPLPTTKYIETFSSTALVITTVSFFMRDILLMHYITFKQSNRIIGTFVLYLFLLYILTPLVLRLLHLHTLLPLLLPSYGQNNFIALIGISGQLGFLGYMVWKRCKKYKILG